VVHLQADALGVGIVAHHDGAPGGGACQTDKNDGNQIKNEENDGCFRENV